VTNRIRHGRGFAAEKINVIKPQHGHIIVLALLSLYSCEVAMTESLFCYCCRVHHPKEQMRPFPTKHGLRWRCIRSIEAAAGGRSARDAFGQQQSEFNREDSRRSAERTVLHRHDGGLVP
jgi:hypothetical protein